MDQEVLEPAEEVERLSDGRTPETACIRDGERRALWRVSAPSRPRTGNW